MVEILAPAGDEKSAYAAINAGCDAIYLGLTAFSARSSAQNFDFESLSKLISYAKFFGVKIYVAMNTLVKESELESFVQTAVKVWNTGASAIIIQDIFLGAYLKREYPQIVLHLSTQAGICNEYGARYAKSLGFGRVILARETKFSDIEKIAKIIETEVFVQGALCTCFSGQCYLSSFAGGNSGNRGKCKQPCRKRYKINRKNFDSYAYRISLSDLSVGESIEKLVEAGVASFKIEGRMRRPEYVSAAVNYYKTLLEGLEAKAQLSALKRTYNRGNYTRGLAFGQDKSFLSSAVQGHIGEFVGTVSVENGKFIIRTAGKFNQGDGFKILRGGEEICGAYYSSQVKGGIELKSSVRLKNGDKAFITTDAALNSRLLSVTRTRKIFVEVAINAGKAPQATVDGKTFVADFICEEAQSRPTSQEDIIKNFSKIDNYPFSVSFGAVTTDGKSFVPVSRLNAFRRYVYSSFFEGETANTNEQIEAVNPLPIAEKPVKNNKTCIVAEDFKGIKADVAVLKPNAYLGDLFGKVKDFNGEKFIYLPPYLSGEDIDTIKVLITPFDGIYSGGNYAVELAKELNKKLFAGVGFNLSNSISVAGCPADYIALSKELSVAEAKPLARENTFYINGGDIKVMDLIYCPFSKTCKDCDRKNMYTLTDENGREFPLRRYEVNYPSNGCRFEIYNCADLLNRIPFTGVLTEKTVPPATYKNHTQGHAETPVL
ncbi:MAG: U32 family peptidase [Candidatus Coproplasma sp.]